MRFWWVWVAACDRPEGPPDWGDVAPLLDRCSGCHDDASVTLPITSYADAASTAEVLASRIAAREMPPWPAAASDVTYLDDPSFTDAEIDTIVRWADAGAPLGTGDPNRALVPPPARTLPRVDAVARMAEPYLPVGAPTDDHRCFVLDRTDLPTDEVYISGIEIVPTDRAYAHHMTVLSLESTDPEDTPTIADAADPLPGWACSPVEVSGTTATTPTTTPTTTTTTTATTTTGTTAPPTSRSFPGVYQQVGGWLPGRSPLVLPDGVGIRIDPAAFLLLKAHYFVPSPASGPDQTEARLALTTQVDAQATELQVSNPLWTRHLSVAVAAHATAVHTITQKVSVAATGLAIDAADGLRVHWVLLHMHQAGVSTSLEVIRGEEHVTLLYIPRWDFDWQLEYWLAVPYDLEPTDQLKVRCQFDNPTDADVWWGEDSADEMCMARLLVSER